MSTKVIVRVVPGGLMAINGVEAEKLEPLKGRQMMVTVSQPRNLKFHRKFFALLGTARDMADTEYNAEQFRAYVTVGAGYCEFVPCENPEAEDAIKLLALAEKYLPAAGQDGTESWALILKITDFIRSQEDGVIAVPKSISFAAMDDTEFERLYQDVLSFICKTWVLDEKQINQIVDFM